MAQEPRFLWIVSPALRSICPRCLARLRPWNKNEPIDQLCVFLWLDDPSGQDRLELLPAEHTRLHVSILFENDSLPEFLGCSFRKTVKLKNRIVFFDVEPPKFYARIFGEPRFDVFLCTSPTPRETSECLATGQYEILC
jgi:hypothetical protein